MIDVLISGKLIRDPATKTGPSGKPFCHFLLSVHTGEGEPVLVSGIAFGDQAERIGRLGRGDSMSVAGSLKPSSWADKASGEVRHGLNVTVSACLSAYDVQRRKPKDGQGQAQGQAKPPPRQAPKGQYAPPPLPDGYGFDDDLIPF